MGRDKRGEETLVGRFVLSVGEYKRAVSDELGLLTFTIAV